MGSRRSSRSASDVPRAIAFATTIVFALAPARVAIAVDKAACVEAHAEAQALRRDGKLRAAQEKLLACAAEGCPALVRSDCGRWIEEVRAQQPTVIFAAKDAAGKDLANVRVRVDGAPAVEALDGKEIAIDPGAHAVSFESLDDGRVVETSIVVKESEKGRVVAVTFPDEEHATSAPTTRRGPLPWIFAGVGVVALGSFVYFGLRGRSQLDDLESTCAPRCDPSDRDSVHTKLLVADVSLGVAVASLGVATWLFLRTPSAEGVSVAPLPGGAIAAWRGVF